jgi:hypothetical protein
MKSKLLAIIVFVFFLSWRKASDGFLLFCTLFAAGLWICVLIYRMENQQPAIDQEE